MRCLWVLLAILFATPAAAQTVVTYNSVPSVAVPCLDASGNVSTCYVPAYALAAGGGGGGTPTAAAGSSSTTAVPVQSVNGSLLATDTTANSLFKAGQSIGNTGFSSLGSAGTTYQQGTGAAGTNAQNVYIGGQFAPLSVTGTFFQATQPVSVASGADIVEGTSADTAYAGSGSTTVIGGLKGIYANQASNNVNTGQLSIAANTSTAFVAARAGRKSVTVEVTSAVQCYYGAIGISNTSGFPLAPTAYAAVTIQTSAAIYAYCTSAAQLAYIENF